MSWEHELTLVGPSSDVIHIHFDESFFIQQEIDGARIITATAHEIISKVPRTDSC